MIKHCNLITEGNVEVEVMMLLSCWFKSRKPTPTNGLDLSARCSATIWADANPVRFFLVPVLSLHDRDCALELVTGPGTKPLWPYAKWKWRKGNG